MAVRCRSTSDPQQFIHNQITDRSIMSKKSFIDFRAVKAAITMEQVLEHYNLLDALGGPGKETLSGPCPIHKGSNPTQFRVNTVKNIWNCFGRRKGGNAL